MSDFTENLRKEGICFFLFFLDLKVGAINTGKIPFKSELFAIHCFYPEQRQLKVGAS